MARKVAIFWFFVAWLFLFSITVLAHSWYDPECCSGQDCDVAIELNLVTKMARTSKGSAPIDAQTKIKESKDSRTHACIRHNRVICLYLAPQT